MSAMLDMLLTPDQRAQAVLADSAARMTIALNAPSPVDAVRHSLRLARELAQVDFERIHDLLVEVHAEFLRMDAMCDAARMPSKLVGEINTADECLVSAVQAMKSIYEAFQDEEAKR